LPTTSAEAIFTARSWQAFKRMFPRRRQGVITSVNGEQIRNAMTKEVHRDGAGLSD
jgi:hypothetical protein